MSSNKENGKISQIRNSTVDFLVFTKDSGENSIEVRVQDGDVWLTQKAIAELFDVDRSVVTKHLKNIFESKELDENSTCANFAQVADNGKTYKYKFKNPCSNTTGILNFTGVRRGSTLCQYNRSHELITLCTLAS